MAKMSNALQTGAKSYLSKKVFFGVGCTLNSNITELTVTVYKKDTFVGR